MSISEVLFEKLFHRANVMIRKKGDYKKNKKESMQTLK